MVRSNNRVILLMDLYFTLPADSRYQVSDNVVSITPPTGVDTRRWPARGFAKDKDHPTEGDICATVWPTQALNSTVRWFDELYLWTEGFHASTTQRARIQWAALRAAFQMLESEEIDRIGVTLSFGTIERTVDHLADAIQAHALVAHRMAILLRGSLGGLRSPYQVRAFREHLRGHHVAVGYLLSAPSISMELKSMEFLQPDFAKLRAPSSTGLETWQNLVFESRVAGVQPDNLIVAGLQSRKQVGIAAQVGIGFGQGNALLPPFAPPAFTPLGTIS